MDGEAVMIHEDECADVALPAEVYVHYLPRWRPVLTRSDDEYVGDLRYMEQPVGRTSVISGFIYISKLFRRERRLSRLGLLPVLIISHWSVLEQEAERPATTA